MNDNEYDGGKVTDVLFTMSFDTKVTKWARAILELFFYCSFAGFFS